MNPYNDLIKKVNTEINDVSPTFCIAKWKQVTMHLQNGHTHSCHHPRTHYIPISEIKKNPTALHNTEFKKSQRKMMLEGTRPKECDYCWRIEDLGNDNYSDRIYKSAESDWAYPYLNEIKNSSWDYDVIPSYVEVSFSNVCNFKCSYCAPQFSSQWMEEIEQHGPYPTNNKFNNLDWLKQENMMPIPNRDENPYVDAFWKWWPDLYKELKYFRITGGEPLLNKNTFKVLNYIIDNPNPELNISINTNLNPPEDLFDKFIEKVKIIIDQNKVKKIKVFTSCEAHGKQAEYIRYGLDYKVWLSNIYKLMNAVPIEITVMSTYNILSIYSYQDFLKDMLKVKQSFKNIWDPRPPLMVDFPYLRYPEHQSIFIGSDDIYSYIEEDYKFIKNNLEPFNGFTDYEADKFKRILDLSTSKPYDDTKLYQLRKDFVKFVDEHDKRRNTNFIETFPELLNFYYKIKRQL